MIRKIIKSFRKNKLACIGVGYLTILLTVALFAPWISPYDPYAMHLDHILEGPSRMFLLGTDNLGRDLLSRLIYGTRTTLLASFIIVSITCCIGTVLGTLAGYYGGIIDDIIMRIVDILMGLPQMVVALGMIAVLGPSFTNILLLLSLLTWTDFARLARGGTISLKESEYVAAARAYGASTFRIIFKHIMPNNLAPIIVIYTLRMAYTILTLSGLSYLGFGIQPPTPDWGNIVSIGQQYILVSPWMAVFSGVAISMTILAFNFIGDGLRDFLDPRQRVRMQLKK
jgi:peptide/nickel transport system permease protein